MTLQISDVPEIRHLQPVEQFFTASDGTKLFYCHWPVAEPARKALVLFHRGHEHSGRFQDLVERLHLQDVEVFAWDARGHGKSPGERGYADSFTDIVRDIDGFIRFVSRQHEIPIQEMVVLGHSVGAVALAAWVHDYAPPIRAMVLVTPALRVKLYVPLAVPALRLRMKLGQKTFVKSYVRSRMLTHDPEQAQAYDDDPLISRQIAVNILLDLHDLSTRLLKDAGAIHTPTLLLSAGSDWVVKNSAQRQFFQRLSSPVKQMETYDGFYHAILHEKDRDRPIACIRRFMKEAFDRDATAEAPAVLDADTHGYTRREYDRLRQPLPPLSLRRMNFAVQRLLLQTVGRLSEGVRIGWRSGFDSGESLDHVYKNRARGFTPLGRLIDRLYLNSVGWRGIRQRKLHLQQALRRAIEHVRADDRRVNIVDIASGPGRYLLEVLSELRSDEIHALLRDCSLSALSVARELAATMNLEHVTIEPGDAFDPESLAAIAPRPNIAIVSGLYELFPDNDRIQDSLTGLARALRSGGYLIYTNQPWHPQIEMIARVLINRDQAPWIMRRRTQAEMDALVRQAGFEKMDMWIDHWGIFTVSLARRT